MLSTSPVNSSGSPADRVVNANMKVNGQEIKLYLATTVINNHKNTNNLNGCITVQGEIEEILSDFKPFVFLRS